MNKFYNPYQFIPATGLINGQRELYRTEYSAIASGRCRACPMVRHDLWHANGLSGRILASLYLNTPTVVGQQQHPICNSQSKRVEQYTWRGMPAIPGNSIKGMIASVAEALSQSTLRVLNKDKDRKLRIHRPGQVDTVQETMPLTAHEYFDHIDEDLKPWSEQRARLTPAEQLFGAVEANERDENSSLAGNLAGRLRFYDARAAGAVRQLAEIPLKILDSPKPPCPAMYYHMKGQRGRYLSKETLHANPQNTDILPNGRKYYLHHPRSQIERQFWTTQDPLARDQLKLRCQPLEADQWFFFHIDFDNLSPAELTLLERALEPASGFQHRLGLGKPLGLGSVTVQIEGVFFIDRQARYEPSALAGSNHRYHRVWRPRNCHRPIEKPPWSSLYPIEQAAIDGTTSVEKPSEFEDASLIDRDTLAILILLGNPIFLEPGLAVRTPILPSQINSPESETFRWFNQNDSAGNQALPPILPNCFLPPLFTEPGDSLEVDTPLPLLLSIKALMPELYGLLIEVSNRNANADIENPQKLKTLLESAPLAEVVVKLEKVQQSRIIDQLTQLCDQHKLMIGNKALRIYKTLSWRPYQKDNV